MRTRRAERGLGLVAPHFALTITRDALSLIGVALVAVLSRSRFGRAHVLQMRIPSESVPTSLKGVRGQALPVAMGALALGAILITPMLAGASTGSQATNLVGIRAKERYSMDAGVEWSGWRLLSTPQLTTVTSFTAVPLQPFPATVNGASFPATDIRFVSGTGAVEAQSPAWQGGGGVKCYTFSASDAGTLSVRVTVPSGTVTAALLAAAASCTVPGGAASGGSPFGADFTLPSAGTYQLLLSTTAATGTIQMSVPAATYEVRSVVASRSVIARLVAGYSGVRVASWQLN